MKKIKKNNLLIDLNHQPVSNRFLKNNKKKNKVFQFKIVQNIDTGLVKIEKPSKQNRIDNILTQNV